MELKMLDFDLYQFKARETAIYPEKGKLGGLLYTTIGLCGESGELANKVKKILRDTESQTTEESRIKISEELGDILWYIAMLCDKLNLRMAQVANNNIQKLQARKLNGKIGGDGDNRKNTIM